MKLCSLSNIQLKYLEEAVRFAQQQPDFKPTTIIDEYGTEFDDDLLGTLSDVLTQPDDTDTVFDFML